MYILCYLLIGLLCTLGQEGKAAFDMASVVPPERPFIPQGNTSSDLVAQPTPVKNQTVNKPLSPTAPKRISSLTKRDNAKGLYRIKLEWPASKQAALFFYKGTGYMVFDQPGFLAGGTFPHDFFKSVSIIPHKSALIVRFRLRGQNDIKLARLHDEWVMLIGKMKNEMPSSLYPLTFTVAPSLKAMTLDNHKGGPIVEFTDPETQASFIVIPDQQDGINVMRRTQLFDVLRTYQGVALLNKAPQLLVTSYQKRRTPLTFARLDHGSLASLDVPSRSPASVMPLVDLGTYDIEPDMILIQQRTLQAKITKAPTIQKRLALEEELAKFYVSVGMYHEAAGVMTLIKKRHPNSFYAADHLLLLYDLANVLAHNIDDDNLQTNNGRFDDEPERHLILALHEHRFGREQVALKHFVQSYKYIAQLPGLVRNDVGLLGLDAALAVGFKKPLFQPLIQEQYLTPRGRDQWKYHVTRAKQLEKPEENFRETYSRLTFSRNHRVALLSHLALTDYKNPHLKSLIKTLESMKYTWRGDVLEQQFLATLADLYLKTGDTDQALRCLRTIDAYLWRLERSHVYTKKAEDIFYKSFMAMKTDPLLKQLGYYYEFEDITPRGRRYGDVLSRVTDLYIKVGLFPNAIKTLDQRLQFLRYEQKRKTLSEGEFNYLSNVTNKRLAELFLITKRYQDCLQTLQNLIPLDVKDTDPKLILKMTNEVKLLKARAHLRLAQYADVLTSLEGLATISAQRLQADAVMGQEKWVEAFIVLGKFLQSLKDNPHYQHLETDAILDLAVVVSHLQDKEVSEALVNEYADRISDKEKRKAFDIIVASKEPVKMRKTDLEKQVQSAADYAAVMGNITSDVMSSSWKADGRIQEPSA